MGNKQTRSPTDPAQRLPIPETSLITTFPKTKDDRYGGQIYVDFNNQMAYRIFDVPAEELADQQFVGMHEISTSSKTIKMTNFDYIHFLQNRMSLRQKEPRLLTATNYRVQKIKSSLLCSFDQRQIIIQYPYPMIGNGERPKKKGLFTLEDRILEFCKIQRPYPELQLREVFQKVASILEFLKINQTCHGDIKPRNIIFGNLRNDKTSPMNSQALEIFLIDSYMANGGKTSYEIVLENPESLSLLSPELLQKLNNKGYQPKGTHDQKFKENLYERQYKTQIFAMGLCMLQAMTAQNAMQCYDLANLKIKDGYFDKKGEQMRKYGYSQDFISLVFACLGIQENRVPQYYNQNGQYPTSQSGPIIMPESYRIDFRGFLNRVRTNRGSMGY